MQKGFTVLELLIVTVVVSVIAWCGFAAFEHTKETVQGARSHLTGL